MNLFIIQVQWGKAELWESIMDVVCDICKSGTFEVFVTYAGFSGKIVKCKECGFIYVIPRPDWQAYLSSYRRGFKSKSLDEWYRRNSLAKKAINQQVMSLVLQNCRAGQGRKKLLDVGCHVGYFLDLAKAHGFETFGLDIVPNVVDYVKARGHNAFCGTLSEVEASKCYDVLTMLEVLEHVTSPSSELREARRVLKDDGLVVIEVPNVRFHLVKGVFERLIRAHLVGLNLEYHLNHFTYSTLKKILVENAYKVIGTYVGKPCSIKELDWSRVFNSLNHVLQLSLDMLFRLTNVHLGSRIIVVARKIPKT